MQLIERNRHVLPECKKGDVTVEGLEDLVAKAKGHLVSLRIRKFNGETLVIQVPSDRLTLSGIRRRLQRLHKTKERINWRYVWSHSCLELNNRYLLVHNMNFDLRNLGLKDKSELSFKKLIRRRTPFGPIKLRENEQGQYVVI